MAKILVVDDDESVARLVAEVVSFCKHTPLIFTDPFLAVVAMREHELGAVLTDYMMPRLDGIDLLNIAQDTMPGARRVLITAAPQEEAVRKCHQSGVAQMVIAKPPGIADIRMALAWL